MKTINQYLDLCKQKFEDDHEYTNISKKECVDFIIDNAFFDGEISASIIDPLKSKIMNLIK
jgi:hypothetical protein